MHDSGVLHVRHMATRRTLPGEVPDRLIRVGKLLGEKPSAVEFGEDTRVAPALACERTRILLGNGPDVEDIDDQQVAGLRAFDGEWSRESVHVVQWGVEDVVGGIVVVDRAVEPLTAMCAEGVSRLHRDRRRNIGMPTVVSDDLLRGERLR